MRVSRLLVLTVMIMLTAALPLAAQATYAQEQQQQGTSQLTITSELGDGTVVEGKFVELVYGNQTISEGFTPATFSLTNGDEYQVGVADFDIYIFDHWLDTGFSDRWRPVTMTSDMNLTAVYDIQASEQANSGDCGEGPESCSSDTSDDPADQAKTGNSSNTSSSSNVQGRYYGPIREMIEPYMGDGEIPEAEAPVHYLGDCLTYVGYVHLRELTPDLNNLQRAWLYEQIKEGLDEHLTSLGLC